MSKDGDRREVQDRAHSLPCCAEGTPDHDDLTLTPMRPGKGPHRASASHHLKPICAIIPKMDGPHP